MGQAAEGERMALGDSYTATVVRAVTCDVIEADITAGPGAGSRWLIRVEGSDGPEPFGPRRWEGYQALQEVIAAGFVAGAVVEGEQFGVDQWGRLFAEIELQRPRGRSWPTCSLRWGWGAGAGVERHGDVRAVLGEVRLRDTRMASRGTGSIGHYKTLEHHVRHLCTIERVIDGDTVDVVVDLGLRSIWAVQRVRLAGYETYELRGADKYRAQASRAVLAAKLEEADVWLLITEGLDRWGRVVADLAEPGSGASVVGWLIGQGVGWRRAGAGRWPGPDVTEGPGLPSGG